MDRYNKYQTMQLHAHTYTCTYTHNNWWLVLGWASTKEDHPRLCINYVDFMARFKCNYIYYIHTHTCVCVCVCVCLFVCLFVCLLSPINQPQLATLLLLLLLLLNRHVDFERRDGNDVSARSAEVGGTAFVLGSLER